VTQVLAASSSGGTATGIIIALILVVVYVAAYWRIFEKAGQPGWAAIIPIYNIIVLLRVIERPWWWILLFLIPFVDIIVYIIVWNDLSKSFGHGIGFTLGLIFFGFIFILILGFGGSQYQRSGPTPSLTPA
jgi:hypothetical protein